MRLWAVLAFAGSLASLVFGAVVISTALFPGILSLMLGMFFVWIGIRSWRDRGSLGDILNRDFRPGEDIAPSSRKE